jgi:hypothetical protein
MSLRDIILAHAKKPIGSIKIDGLTEDFWIKSWSIQDAITFQVMFPKGVEPDLNKFADVVIMSLCDEAGQPVFKVEDREVLTQSFSMPVMQKIVDAAIKLNLPGGKSAEKKTDGKTDNSSSSSGSQLVSERQSAN